MPVEFSYVIPLPVQWVNETDATPSPLDRDTRPGPEAHLGFGLVRPFRRDEKNDFANTGGVPLVKACVGQVLGMQGASETVQGELTWDPERGSLLYLLRHQKNAIALQELARIYVADALKKYEPRIVLKNVRTTREEAVAGEGLNVLSIRLVYDVLKSNVPGNQVLFSDVEQTITVKG